MGGSRTLPFFFRLIEQFSEACKKEQAAEKLFQQLQVDLPAEPGAADGSQAADCDGGQHITKIDGMLPPPEHSGDQGAGEKEQQVDCPGFWVWDADHSCEPEHQQTAAAYAQSGQNPEDGTDQALEYQHRYRTPPQMIKAPKAL